MSKKHSGVNYSKHLNAIKRRKSVIDRLENQLKLGTKPAKYEDEGILNLALKTNIQVPLEEKDIKRIKKELSTLKERV